MCWHTEQNSLHADIKIIVFLIIELTGLYYYVLFFLFSFTLSDVFKNQPFPITIIFPSDQAEILFFHNSFACQRRSLLSAVNLCKQRPKSDPIEFLAQSYPDCSHCDSLEQDTFILA